jgi:hypothetical protein
MDDKKKVSYIIFHKWIHLAICGSFHFSGTEFPFDFAAGLATGGKPKPSIAVPLSLTLSPLWLSKEDNCSRGPFDDDNGDDGRDLHVGGSTVQLLKKIKNRGPLIKVQSVEYTHYSNCGGASKQGPANNGRKKVDIRSSLRQLSVCKGFIRTFFSWPPPHSPPSRLITIISAARRGRKKRVEKKKRQRYRWEMDPLSSRPNGAHSQDKCSISIHRSSEWKRSNTCVCLFFIFKHPAEILTAPQPTDIEIFGRLRNSNSPRSLL